MFAGKKIVDKIRNDGPVGFFWDATKFAEILLDPDFLKTEARIKRVGTINRNELKQIASTVEYYSEPEYHLIEYEDRDALPINLSEQPTEYSLEQPFVASLNNATITGNSGMVVYDGKLVLESFMANRTVLARKISLSGDINKLSELDGGSAQRSIETACSLIYWTSPSATGYYGWLCRYLLTLQGIDQWSGKTPTLILPADPPEWMVDSVELLGYGTDDWIEWDATNGDLLVEELIIPSCRKRERIVTHQMNLLKNHIYNKDYDRGISLKACRWVRDKYSRQITPELSDARLFISRQNSRSRAIANLNEIKPILDQFGFEIIRLEELPFPTQMELFLSADIVIGAHGAGLSNTIVSEDIQLLEIFGNKILPTYFITASTLGHEYNCMLAKENDSGDLEVDDELFRKMLKKMVD